MFTLNALKGVAIEKSEIGLENPFGCGVHLGGYQSFPQPGVLHEDDAHIHSYALRNGHPEWRDRDSRGEHVAHPQHDSNWCLGDHRPSFGVLHSPYLDVAKSRYTF